MKYTLLLSLIISAIVIVDARTLSPPLRIPAEVCMDDTCSNPKAVCLKEKDNFVGYCFLVVKKGQKCASWKESIRCEEGLVCSHAGWLDGLFRYPRCR